MNDFSDHFRYDIFAKCGEICSFLELYLDVKLSLIFAPMFPRIVSDTAT